MIKCIIKFVSMRGIKEYIGIYVYWKIGEKLLFFLRKFFLKCGYFVFRVYIRFKVRDK